MCQDYLSFLLLLKAFGCPEALTTDFDNKDRIVQLLWQQCDAHRGVSEKRGTLI